MLATELRQLRSELVDIANRDDGNGEYLFAGTSTEHAAVSRGTTGVNYLGDQTTRLIRVSPAARRLPTVIRAPKCS